MMRFYSHLSRGCGKLFSAVAFLVLTAATALAQESNGPALLPEVSNVDTNAAAAAKKMERLNFALSTARLDVETRDFQAAEKYFLLLLAEDVPDDLQKTALFEMGETVQAADDLSRAQSIFAQYQQRWPNDARSPEICLHQGQLFRSMGMNQLALAKFYAVMTTALALKSDQLPYYKRLVLQAQVEIAETHYLIGKFADAAEYYSRLLNEQDPALDRAQIQFRLVRSLVAIDKFDDAASQAQDFLTHYADSPEEPEMRYHLAQALKGLGRNADAMQQVLIFLKEERAQTKDHPEVWTYWQQRVGNEIGNALYQEGDFIHALQVYVTLSQLDAAPAWQLPVNYQIGITYEKLLQPSNAIVAYRSITNSAVSLGTNTTDSLKSVAEMAQWRLDYLQWQERAEDFNQRPQIDSTNLPDTLSKR
ncbi:MAG TPA: tetratricopeptide repeat protein [Candidatus Sulfotelmatobacter sp.]|jgi:tetratricopeptide (TPR) repeat protein|nr:tetratricopeptide repeat protein [Candidatus Sulfotelmatobacter sp.]